MQPKDSYRAGNEIYSAYLLTDFYPTEALLVNLGLRYEMSKQWVRYASDGGDWYSRRRNLDKNDLFPALNLKYAGEPHQQHPLLCLAHRHPSLVHRDGTLPLSRVLRFGTNPR